MSDRAEEAAKRVMLLGLDKALVTVVHKTLSGIIDVALTAAKAEGRAEALEEAVQVVEVWAGKGIQWPSVLIADIRALAEKGDCDD